MQFRQKFRVEKIETMSMKSGSRGANFGRGNDEEGGQKPLAATLLQEFQNLREKLKNEDDGEVKGNDFELRVWCFYWSKD